MRSNLEFSHSYMRFWKNSLEVSLKVKYTFIYSSHSTPKYLPTRNESMCLYKDLHTNVHSSFTCISQELEITQMSIRRWLCKQIMVHAYCGIVCHKSEWTVDTNNIAESQKIILREKSWTKKSKVFWKIKCYHL